MKFRFLPFALPFAGISLLVASSLACSLGGTPETPVAPAAPGADATASTTGEADIVVHETPRIAKARRAPPAQGPDNVVRGRYVLKLKNGAGSGVDTNGRLSTGNPRIDAALGKAGMKKARAVHRRGKKANPDLYAVDSDDDAALRSLGNDPDVEYVEPVLRYDMAAFSDPYYKYQWNMSGLELEAVHARAQGQGVIVGVVDSGVTRGADSPVNLLKGWDFQDDDADASDTAAATQSSSGSHGTHVAGTIAQASNNGVGVTGIAPMASILPVRVGDYNGITSENIAEGIEWAVDNGAQVINISIGGASNSRVVEDACKYAYDKGVVVVAASGNDGYDGKISYPAALKTVIAVGAHDGASKETAYSNNGRELALLAPGGDTGADLNRDGKPDGILQGTVGASGWGYALMQGTSMASPHVAGAAAILISAGVSGPDAVRAALLGGATQQGAFKVLNILGSLDYAKSGNGTEPVAGGSGGRKGKGGEGKTGDGGGRAGVTPGEGRGSAGVAPGAGGRGERPAGGKTGAGEGGKGAKAGAGAGKGEKAEKAGGRKKPGQN